MSRRALVFFLAITGISFALGACGGSGGGGGSLTTPPDLPSTTGSGTGDGSTPPPAAMPSPPPSCGCTMIKEKPTKDKLLGGIAVGDDNNLYATTAVGVDIFNQQLNLLPSPSPAEARIRQTWPSVPKNSAPQGIVAQAGAAINVLGTIRGGTSSASGFIASSGPQPTPDSRPIVAQYNTDTDTWFNVSQGVFGDKWVSLSAPGGTSVFVVGDHFTSSKGWTGYLFGIGVGCISPSFTHPLGASTIGPDGNLWVATDPSLNSKSPSNIKTNPSMLFVVSPTTGAIKQSFTLPSGSHVSAMAAGGHAVWFTDDGLNDVGFVPIGGTGFTLIPLPDHGTAQAPVSITPDSIGRMWFTEFNGKRVGYVTPMTQLITLFKVTGAPIGIVGCVRGQNCPAQNVFFAEVAALGNASF
ncbi:MAG: hypothetical protein JO322_10370 [Candidatus Eremiobacteraeota bacterium]|nr:hypothetical protein [Candidatus Eremiobacteraeota bacterium]